MTDPVDPQLEAARLSCAQLAPREWESVVALTVSLGWRNVDRQSMRRLGEYLTDPIAYLQKYGHPSRDEREAWLRRTREIIAAYSSDRPPDVAPVAQLLGATAIVIEDLVKRPNEWMRPFLDEEPPFPDPPSFILQGVPFETPEWFEAGHFYQLGVPTNAWTLIAGRNTGRHTALHRLSIKYGRRFLNLAFQIARHPTWIQPYDPQKSDFALVGAADMRTGYLIVACVLVPHPEGGRDEVRIKSAYPIGHKRINKLLRRPVGNPRRLVEVSSLHFEPEERVELPDASNAVTASASPVKLRPRSQDRLFGAAPALAFILIALLLARLFLS